MVKSREHFALDWIKGELLETLNDARETLESYVESDRDGTRMRACLTSLHQVHGTLVMLELEGVTLLADHLERLAQAMWERKVEDEDLASQALMQGILELPGHIEEVRNGVPDSTGPVLALVNELRAHLNEKPLARQGDVSRLAADQQALDRFDGIDGVEKARKIRSAYQQVLLSVLKGQDIEGAVTMLGKVAFSLQRVCEGAPQALQWQAFGEFVESLKGHSGPLPSDALKLLRRVDSEIRDLAKDGAAALRTPVSSQLVEQLLDAAERRGHRSPQAEVLRKQLATVPSEQGMTISGKQALASAASALREELLLVKDKLDLIVRQDGASADELSALVAPLKQIGSTLSLLGFESSKTIVADQIEILNKAIDGQKLNQSELLSVASALVQVDENLSSFSQGGKGEAERITDDAQRAVISEARAGLEQVKQEIVDFISSQWDARHLKNTGSLLAGICGALDMIPLPRVSRLLANCSSYIAGDLIEGPQPSWEQMDHLADAISGADYYLERLNEEHGYGADDVLDLVERSLNSLGVDLSVVPKPAAVDQPALVRDVAEVDFEVPDAEVPDVEANDADVDSGEFEIELIADSDEVSEAEPDTRESEDLEIELNLEPEEELDLSAPELEEITNATVESAPVEIDDREPVVDVESVRVDEENEDAEPVLEMDSEGGFDLGENIFDDLAPTREADATLAADHEPGIDAQTIADVEPGLQDERVESVAVRKPQGPLPTLADTFESDPEIVEIFVEEVGEVLETVDQWIPQWRKELASEEALGEVRRAFHTLKGSGRIVGANVIGEVAWSVENMLNRLIDGTVEPSDQFVQVVEEARSLVPELRDAFEIRDAPDMNGVGWIMERADVLASGGTLEEAEPETDAGEAVELTSEDDGTLAVFVAEANAHLGVLAQAAKDGGIALTEESLRALHTLSGSAGMAGIESVAELARPTYELASLLRADRDRTATGEFGDYLRRAIAALLQTVDDLAAGREPEDHFLLVAEVDHLIVAAGDLPETEEAAASQSALMGLEGLAVIMDAPDYLRSWHEGAMDLEFGDKLVAALEEVSSVAEAENHRGIADLCRALGAAHEHLAHEVLTDSSLNVLERSQERLLGLFDALAAEQNPVPVDDTVAELARLLETVAFEDDLVEVPAATPPVDSIEADALARGESPDIEDKVDDSVDIEIEEISLDSLSDDLLADIAEETSNSERAAELMRTAQPEEEAPSVEGFANAEVEDVSEGPSAENESVLPEEIADLLPEDLDSEIIEVFFEEADELLEALESSIEQWKSEPDNRLHLEHMLRGLHTLKGGARLSGLTKLGDSTHQYESFLIDAQTADAKTDSEFFAELHDRYDELASLLTLIRRALAGDSAAPPTLPKADILTPKETSRAAPRVKQPAKAADVPAEKPAKSPEPGAPKEATNVRSLKPLAASSEPKAAAPAKVERPDQRTAQEMVRVGSGLLETLVNLAGESSIIRARVEQGLSDFTLSLDEMETTIDRLREQLRRLEIETEAQILFRQDRPDGPSYAQFDPLEMDRYSQLQQLSRGLSESASDMLDLKDTLLFKARESETLLLQQARINTELQEGLMRTRMVPFSRLLPRLRRIVRQVASELGKEVELHAYNAEGELDRSLLERMVPPLEHMLRNAVDHGIESAELRKNFGKPSTGRIDLRLSREGGDVVIEISDDGAGIDVESVRAKAVERGLMVDSAKLRDDEVIQFVLAPGFSTAKSVTQISGRGVGMDVVHSEVKQLGGSIQIASRAGRGSRFVLRVPFTVSVNRALMVSVGDDLYAIPLNNIEGIVLLSPAELERLYAPDGNTFEYAGIPYRVRYLGHYLGREFRAANQPSSIPVVLVRSGDHAVAVHVDSVQGSREIVVKSLGPQFAGVGGISGATILGDGSVVVILDLLALIRAQSGENFVGSKRALGGAVRTRCVMVVDDSVTVRKVTSRLLERQGMDVIVAKDGVEAVALLQERRPDVMLLDIEMPRMDGFEVARQVRHDERLKDLPIVMISSRTGEKHQEHAAQLGVNSFLGKPFQENELLATIDRLVD